MSRILEGLEGVVCQIDDILVFGKDQEQHDRRLPGAEAIGVCQCYIQPKEVQVLKKHCNILGTHCRP